MLRRARPVMLLLLAGPARAERSTDVSASASLTPQTELHVDILDATTETVRWTGLDSAGDPVEVVVTGEDGTTLGTYASGSTLTLPTAGTWVLQPTTTEKITSWEVIVEASGTEVTGRVWSYQWGFDPGGFARTDALTTHFYVVVSGGSGTDSAVVEMSTAGMTGGTLFHILANATGVPGANGWSQTLAEAGVDPEDLEAAYPVYLAPPALASYAAIEPSVSDVAFAAGEAGCDEVAPGALEGEVTFTSDVDGTYHLLCDLDGDGSFDVTSDEDLHLLGEATTGTNTASWSGLDGRGDPVPPGTYTCRVLLTVGEFHYVAYDVETSFQGFRLFQLDSAGERFGLPMFWNDEAVAASDVVMPDGQASLLSSGADGVDPGSYEDAVEPNVNARSWGDFTDAGKGDEAFLDTFTWIYEDVGADFLVTVSDPALDGDADGLSDLAERCTWGTDPALADTDGGGRADGDEVGAGLDPSDPTDDTPADTATETADETGTETADTSVETADTSVETADTSVETADTSVETSEPAETADTTLDTAPKTGETSFETADTSTETADTSIETADTSAETAETAPETADTSETSHDTTDTSPETAAPPEDSAEPPAEATTTWSLQGSGCTCALSGGTARRGPWPAAAVLLLLLRRRR